MPSTPCSIGIKKHSSCKHSTTDCAQVQSGCNHAAVRFGPIPFGSSVSLFCSHVERCSVLRVFVRLSLALFLSFILFVLVLFSSFVAPCSPVSLQCTCTSMSVVASVHIPFTHVV